MPADLKENPPAAHSDKKGRGHGPDPADASASAHAMLQLFRNLPALVLLAGVIFGLILGHHLVAAGSGLGLGLVLIKRLRFDYLRKSDETRVSLRLDGPD